MDAGAHIDARDHFDSTPLHYAVQFNSNPGVVKLLLDRGADIEALNVLGLTPLYRAATQFGGSPEMASLLLDHGADVNAGATVTT